MKMFNILFVVVIFSGIYVSTQADRDKKVEPQDLGSILNGMPAGDTVLVKPGTYSGIELKDRHFTQENPLIIRAEIPGSVLVKGDTISRGSALELQNCSYIVFEGITFTNAMWGIYVKGSTHIILNNNEIHSTGQEGCHIGRSSKYVDVTGNKIHNTGLYNSKWAEGVYVGSGTYSGIKFPDNCEYIWIEGNHIFETGNAEAVNVKGECFHITIRNNTIHDIHPGTSEQYNQAAITVETAAYSLEKNYRVSEKRDVWVENNTIRNVSHGYSDWNNGIMFFGSGVYILNNTIENCINKGIYGSNWKDMGLLNYVHGNKIVNCGQNIYIYPDLKIKETDPGKNPHSPQMWYAQQ